MRPSYNVAPNRFRMILIIALAIAVLLSGGLSVFAHASGDPNPDPVSVKIEIAPTSLSGPSNVHVNIMVINVGDDEVPGALVLTDPAGERVSTFGSGGSLTLAQSKQYPWQGEWFVTQEQLNAGYITYKLTYPRMINGAAQNITKDVTARIAYSQPAPTHKINFQRNISSMTPEEGDTVTIDYILENTGGLNLRNVYIEDAGVGVKKDDLFVDSLAIGAKVTKSYSFKMGAATVSSQPTIYYTPEGSDKAISGTVEKILTITPTRIDITATLTASKEVVNRGDSVNLVCEIKNAGAMAYSNIKITEATLGDIAQNINLGAKKTYKETKSIKVSAPGTYRFDITGQDKNGNPLTLSSNEVTIHTREDAKPVSLAIAIEADRDVVYTDPATAIFIITVTNIGEETAKNIVVSEFGKSVYTIPQLKPGEQDTRAKEFTLSMGGKFQFAATAKNSLGTESKSESNTAEIVYQAPKPTPSPTPTLTPTPTPAPTPTPTTIVSAPVTPSGSGSFGQILLYVLAGLLVLILAGVGAMFMLDRRKAPTRPTGGGSSSSSIEVIDHLDRTPRRDYTRAAKNAAKAGSLPVLGKVFSKRKADAQPVGEDEYSSEPNDIDESPESRYAPSFGSTMVGDSFPDLDVMDELIEPEIPSLGNARADDLYADVENTQVYDRDRDIAAIAERYAKPKAADESSPTPDYKSAFKADPKLAPREPKLDLTSSSNEPKPTDDAEPDPEAGSAGMYRLTRRAGTLRPKTEPSINVSGEDPTAFAKKQRTRRGREINTAQFYQEDEDS